MVKVDLILDIARIAQLVEQWIEDPRVTSSNLVLGSINEYMNLHNKRNYLTYIFGKKIFQNNPYHFSLVVKNLTFSEYSTTI